MNDERMNKYRRNNEMKKGRNNVTQKGRRKEARGKAKVKNGSV
jgi:hypothetical protein